MILSFLIVIAGFVSLIFGGNSLVDGASSLAKKFKVSDLAIGLTVVAFGTSAPELIVNIIASSNGYSDIVLGNIIGSNNFNLFIILGLSALIYPITVQSATAWKEIPISLLVTLLVYMMLNNFIFAPTSELARWEGIFLLILFLIFLLYVFKQMKNEPKDISIETPKSNLRIWGLIIFGLAGLILGGQLVVSQSIKIASALGVSEKIIGLTIVAAGTSLPELVTSIVAATKKNSDIAIGNVIGSNIFNLLPILALSSIIQPIPYNTKFNLDLHILMAGTLFTIIAMIVGQKKKVDRWEASLMLMFFIGYTIYLVYQEL